MGSFTTSELERAKSVDLKSVASGMGYTVKRIGNLYTIKEMDSIRIYPDNHWYRWSGKSNTGITGGSQIDFMMEFGGMDIKEAVAYLLDFSGAGRNEPLKKDGFSSQEERSFKPFFLPDASSNNMRITDYLMGKRGLSLMTINFFVEEELFYESAQYHNIVFLGFNPKREIKFASMRGIYDRNGKPFKCDVAGSDKRYAFHLEAECSDTVLVFEGAIDLMSYFELYGQLEVHMLALGMTADNPLRQYLTDHPEIKNIGFCLDNDEPGRRASYKLAEEYIRHGYRTDIHLPPDGCKDFNDLLVARGKARSSRSRRSR